MDLSFKEHSHGKATWASSFIVKKMHTMRCGVPWSSNIPKQCLTVVTNIECISTAYKKKHCIGKLLAISY